ncbi:alpha-N-arabinofuranosidase [Parabacteroides sp. PFB2-12]|uniref:alpha-N-arabinofuranosidase n=1 Tax=unclassified Parabacteroides TaxID=2649774 RepID=UPI0024735B2A|nr:MULTISPECIES: alpha-N-arabinofuranosidase [unclassified Parabacteroides]MDH6341288.1 alpha-N-arabinofuranosidase [Parabacteroides sp. PM6-13]MDH6389080.1 alpha-N-arabinofuranosidase [Parabacteroides sp. PFB2-12]
MKKSIILGICTLMTLSLSAQEKAEVVVNADLGTHTISRHIYGHFSEHLGRSIYGGIWVGEESSIPNTNGVRNDVVAALKQLKIPNLRWPGGCFADEYHWRDGIGPREQRPKMVNTHWGGVVEDNSFGTHEFLNLCELLETEPYICGNMGSGTVEEMSKWVEYITFDGESPMANLRRENGREKPWAVKFWGVGNENWGCGGNMSPEGYAENYRRYATYCRNYGDNRLYKIAGGPNVDDYRWTETLMKNIPRGQMNGLSLHYYTYAGSWTNKGNATGFPMDEYYSTLENALRMDELLTRHSAIMDQYDPQKRVELVVDEWGAWYNVEPGTNPGFLYQQNTLRDAILAGLTFNIFHRHADRVKIANIAQMVNVLQAIILTEGDKMMLTPTYHVFDMYKVHQDATLLPADVKCGTVGRSERKRMPMVSVTASKDNEGAVHISFVNIDPTKDIEITCPVRGLSGGKITDSQLLTAKDVGSFNTFDKPEEVTLTSFKGASFKNGELRFKLPAKSLVTIELK